MYPLAKTFAAWITKLTWHHHLSFVLFSSSIDLIQQRLLTLNEGVNIPPELLTCREKYGCCASLNKQRSIKNVTGPAKIHHVSTKLITPSYIIMNISFYKWNISIL